MADPNDEGRGERVLLYDTTLRDGAQREGMALSVGEKLRLVHLADALGVHVIEAGFPASNPKDAETFAALEQDGSVTGDPFIGISDIAFQSCV